MPAYYDDKTYKLRWGRIIATVLGIVIALTVVFGILGLANDWFNEGRRIVGPENVSAQHRAIIGDYEGMISAAQNACNAEDGAKRSQDDPTFVEDPAAAYAASFYRIREDYQRRQKNLFEAKLVGPSGYPTNVENKLNKESWCEYADTLIALNPR